MEVDALGKENMRAILQCVEKKIALADFES